MKRKRKLPYIVIILAVVIYLAALVSTSLSVMPSLVDSFDAMTGNAKVRFSNGRFPADAESVSVVLIGAEEAEKLNEFTGLKELDLSGSTCYDAILSWASEHPEVSVKYSVAFPTGFVADSGASAVDLTGLTHESAQEAASLMKYLPAVSSVNLGSSDTSASPINSDDINLFRQAVPGAAVDYSLAFLGKQYSINDDSADLSGLTSAQLPEAENLIASLPNLKTIKLEDNVTETGVLSWEDISAFAAACPEAAIDYSFSICGTKASLSDTSLKIDSIKSADVASAAKIMSCMSQLESVDIGGSSNGLSWDDIAVLCEAAPQAAFDYDFNLCGKDVSLADEVLDLNHIAMDDGGAAVKAVLPYMHALQVLDMDSCGVSNTDMAAIRDANPDVEVIWRINFGENYSVRTNVTKILASKPSKGGTLYNDVGEQLKYCTNVHYLDLGHNENISDFSFVANMPELEIAVISMSTITDLTPFASCTHLKYLEAGNTKITDLSPLASCTELKHLNVGTCEGVKDISCLYDLDLKRLWLGVGDPVPKEQVEEMRSRHPDCEVNTTCSTGLEDVPKGAINEGYTAENWKYYQQYLDVDWKYYSNNNNTFPAQRPLGYYKVVYKAFQYNLADGCYSFSWNDPKFEPHDDTVEPVNTYVIDVSLLSENWEDEGSLVPDVLDDPPGETLYVGKY